MNQLLKSPFLIFAIILMPLLNQSAWAGRPVFETVNRDELIAHSDFIFSGYPSPQKSKIQCVNESGRWQVHKVYRGDKSLEGSIISIADHGYQYFRDPQGKPVMPPSFQAYKFREGLLDRNSITSILFTKRNKDGCFELAAQGAQESDQKAIEIQSLVSLPLNCELSKSAFEFRLGSFPKSCKLDSDCGQFYIHPSSCEAPMIFSKAANENLKSDEFLKLQANFRTACAQEWSKQPACEAQNVPFRCHNSVCEKGLSAPTAAKIPPLTTAKISNSCAPHDASSYQFVVKAGDLEYPLLSVNWWGPPHPSIQGAVSVLRAKGTGSMEDGFQASYCSFKMGCKQLKDIYLKTDIKAGAKDGTLEFEFHTEDGELKKGKVPVHYESDSQALCG